MQYMRLFVDAEAPFDEFMCYIHNQSLIGLVYQLASVCLEYFLCVLFNLLATLRLI